MESGPLTVTRFRVIGEIPDDFREFFRERLNEYSFKENLVNSDKEQEGWVLAHNLLKHDFEIFNDWLFNSYIVLNLRVDKKTLPGLLFKAHLATRCENWARDNQVERCPSTVKKQLKEALEQEWMSRAFPQVSLTEICWNITDGYAIVYSQTESVLERVQRRFYRTFGFKLAKWCMLDDLPPAIAHDLSYSPDISAFQE